MSSGLRLIVLVMAVLFAPGCRLSNWALITDRDVAIYGNTAEFGIDRLAPQVRNVRDLLEVAFFSASTHSGPTSLTVIAYNDMDEIPGPKIRAFYPGFRRLATVGIVSTVVETPMSIAPRFLPSETHTMPIVGGLTLEREASPPGRFYVVVWDEAPLRLLAHQLAHALVAAHHPSAPVWFHEGFATMVETLEHVLETADGARLWMFGHKAFNQGKLLPLARVLESSWYSANTSHYADYSFSAYTLLDLLMIDDAGKLRPHALQAFRSFGNNQPLEQTLAEYVDGLPLASVEAAYEKRAERLRSAKREHEPIQLKGRAVAPPSWSELAKAPVSDEELEAMFREVETRVATAKAIDWLPTTAQR